MKRTITILFFLVIVLLVKFLGFESTALAQTVQEKEPSSLTYFQDKEILRSPNPTISIQLEKVPLEHALEEIAKKAKAGIYFDADLLPEKTVSLDFKEISLSEILKLLLEDTGLEVYTTGRNILLREKITTEPVIDEEVVEVSEMDITITGTVVDAQTGEALPGVNVILVESEDITGTIIGTTTDMDGTYEIQVPEGLNTLAFSYIGYLRTEIEIDSRNTINVELYPDIAGLDELVVVGYGTIDSHDFTGSISRITGSEIARQATTSLQENLSGKISGLRINQGTSASGGGSLEVRGTTSLKASNVPLYVVDGVIYNGSLSDINPTDIESVDVLKDASAAAVFGARSASGVIIITTKRGKTGVPSISFSSRLGIVGLSNHMRPNNPEEYLQAKVDYYRTRDTDKPIHYFSNPENLPSDLTVEDWINYDQISSGDPIGMWLSRLNLTDTERQNYIAGNTVNWYDEVLRKGIRQDYDLSLSGGIEDVIRYYWSGGYTHNEGYIIGDEFKIFRSRLNIDADVSDFFTLRLNMQFSDRDQGFQSASLSDATRASPYGSIYDENGDMTWYPHEEVVSVNPLIYHTYRDRLDKTQRLFANLSGELNLPYGFVYTISYVNRYSMNRSYSYDATQTPNGAPNNGIGSRSNSFVYEWQVDNLLKWRHDIQHMHSFDLTLLFNVEKFQLWSDSQTNRGFSLPDILSFHNLGAGSNPSISNNDQYSTGNALMGRLNYSLLNKYIFTLSMRRDGYSAFGQDNPNALFPSAAFAWRVSEENFFDVSWIDHLKIRTSWGMNGNRDIGRYDALARVATVGYIENNQLALGFYNSNMENRALKWEKTNAINLGVDFSVFNDRISGSFNVYRQNTNDLLIDRSLPDILGYSSVVANLGEVQNKGLELDINSVNINVPGKFHWHSSFIFSLNRNKIVSLYGDMVDVYDEQGNVIGQREADDSDNGWFIGKSIHRIWDYKLDGIWQEGEEEEASQYGARPGDFKIRDLNGDGRLTNDDKVFQGYKVPRYRLGVDNSISYLNFDLSIFIRADLDFYRNNTIDQQSYWMDRRNIYNVPYWTPENPTNKYTRISTEENPIHSVWKNSSFIRLQDVSLSYNVPTTSRIIEQSRIHNLRVYLHLRNHYTITKWNHWDPESGMNPMPKYTTFGIDISF